MLAIVGYWFWDLLRFLLFVGCRNTGSCCFGWLGLAGGFLVGLSLGGFELGWCGQAIYACEVFWF